MIGQRFLHQDSIIQRFLHQDSIMMHALLFGQSLTLSSLRSEVKGADAPLLETSQASPVWVEAGDQGAALLFDYGAVALMGLSPVEEARFLADLASVMTAPFETPESERVILKREPHSSGKVDGDKILLAAFDGPRLQIVANVLAKSVVLAKYEMEAAAVFEQIEPFAVSLQKTRWRQRQQGQELLQQIGNALLIQNKLVGQAAIVDKPELLWEYPEFERLYLRVEDEYEIRERHLVLEKKLDLVSRTVETALELQRQTTSLRLEWYIVILIVLELLLSLYELFIKG
ncbi:MAG: RMD1 family protein [Cyanobacteria bacterium P01_A01_bin.114]